MGLALLNQNDFVFGDLIQDLGMVYATKVSKEKKRQAIFICHTCLSKVTMSVASAKKAVMCVNCRNSKNKLHAVSHKDSSSKLYVIWKNMKSRCLNINHPQAKDYSIRGIIIYKPWIESYELFQKWALLSGYKEELSLDRIDNDKGYFPNNCRFTSTLIQNRNKQKIMLTNTSGYRGVSKTTDSSSWSASISVDSHKIHIGCAPSAVEAARLYDAYIYDNGLEHTVNGVI